MKTLIVEDDLTSRTLLVELLKKYGKCHLAANGVEAMVAVAQALQKQEPYDLICLDILMPEMNGQQALEKIRKLESEAGVDASHPSRIIMTTALADVRHVSDAYGGLCDSYLVKPIDAVKLNRELQNLGLIEA